MRTELLVMIPLITGLVMPAAAQDDAEAPPDEETIEPVRRYTVELIIFAYDESVSAGNEVWIPEEPEPEPDNRAGFGRFFSDRAQELKEIEAPAFARQYMDVDLELMRKQDFAMNEIYDKLVKLDAYEPLVRAGWTQSTFDKAVTAPISLDRLARSPPWLDGSLTLYLGRYLHLVVDLTMTSDRSAVADEEDTALPSFGDSRARSKYQRIDEYGDRLPAPVRYRILEDRIMKSGDIRYFDHPKFGMIAKVSRVEESEEEVLDDTDDLLPGSAASP